MKFLISFVHSLYEIGLADCSFAVFTLKALSDEALNTSIISIVLSIPWGCELLVGVWLLLLDVFAFFLFSFAY